jgi:hypothetical protein
MSGLTHGIIKSLFKYGTSGIVIIRVSFIHINTSSDIFKKEINKDRAGIAQWYSAGLRAG